MRMTWKNTRERKDFFRRFPQASKISCNHYKEIFNPSGQNFRLQKKKPSLIWQNKGGSESIPSLKAMGLVDAETIISHTFSIAFMIVAIASSKECFLLQIMCCF